MYAFITAPLYSRVVRTMYISINCSSGRLTWGHIPAEYQPCVPSFVPDNLVSGRITSKVTAEDAGGKRLSGTTRKRPREVDLSEASETAIPRGAGSHSVPPSH